MDVIEEMSEASGGAEFMRDLEPIKDAPVAAAHGIAAIALNIAMKYHDISTIKDGAMYQQFKLEGRNITTIGLADVFETAIRIEMHLLGASDRIAKIVVDALEFRVEDEADDPVSPEQSPPPPVG